MKSVYAKLLGFFQSFANKYLKKNLNEIVNDELWNEALKIIEYSDELQKRAEDRFKEEGIDINLVIDCRRCHHRGFVVQDEIDTCYVCGDVDQSGMCEGCKEFFYIDELFHLHYEDDLFCEECRNSIMQKYYDDEAQYYS